MRKKFVFYLLIFLSFLSFSENEEYYDKISEDFDVALNQLRELEPTHKIIFKSTVREKKDTEIDGTVFCCIQTTITFEELLKSQELYEKK